jgi:chaperonin GroEL (HSP60 family)
MASEMQEKEVGDGTNFTIIFASALLQKAADLLQMVNWQSQFSIVFA